MKKTLSILLALTLASASQAEDKSWPMWGRDGSRNMVAPGQSVPTSFNPGKTKGESEEIDLATTKNVKWAAKLGSESYGNVTVSGGKVFIGTNNKTPRDPKHQGDRGVIMCFDEKSGKLQWQLVVPKLGAGKVSDWEYLGICSSPAISGNRGYIVTNRCEVLCFDTNGLSDGNQGMTDEGKFMGGPGKPEVKPGPTDADIIWRFDMRDELGVFPHNIASNSPLVFEDRVYVCTSNGQDWSHINIPAPYAPSLIVLNAKTGEQIAEDEAGISQRVYHCQWSSPAIAKVGDVTQVFLGGGDGFCYSFNAKPVKGEDFDVVKELWRFDCNPAEYKIKDGKKIKYPTTNGPSEIIGTPVFYKNKVYVAIGQDPEHGDGVGNIACIDATKKGDITKSGKVWNYKIGRTISTVSVADDLVFAAEYAGFINCLDANTGKLYWRHNMEGHIWASTIVVGGHVYLGDEDGDFVVLKAAKKKELVSEVNMNAPIYSSAIAANNVLYVGTQTHLYAISK